MAQIEVLEGAPREAEARPPTPIPAENGVAKPSSLAPRQPVPSQKAAKSGTGGVPLDKKATPAPPFRNYDSDGPKGHQPADFFRYWCSLDPVFWRRLMAYVYRIWPVVRYEVPTKTGTRQSSQQAKVSGEDPIQGVEDLLHRFGSGDYVIKLNDASNLNKTICQLTIKGLRQMDDHPPLIPNMDWLTLDDPANASYIAGLRMKGVRFPGDEPEGGGEMAAGVDRLATTVERLVMDKADGRETARRKDAAEEATGMRAVVDVMSDASKKGSQIMSDAITQASAIAAKGSDPSAMLSLVEKIVEVRERVNRPPDALAAAPQIDLKAILSPVTEALSASRDEAKDLRVQVANMQSEQLKLVREMLAAQLDAQKPAEPVKPPTLRETLKDMMDARDGLKDLLGIEDKEEEPIVKASDKDPIWARLLLAGINMLPGALQVMSYNLAVAKAGGVPMKPELTALNPSAASGAPSMGGGMTPVVQSAEEGVAALLLQVRNPILRSIRDNGSGSDFASLLTEWTGDPLIHAQLKEQGKEALMAMLASDPPIKQVMDALPQRFSTFVDGFLAWNPEAEEADGAA